VYFVVFVLDVIFFFYIYFGVEYMYGMLFCCVLEEGLVDCSGCLYVGMCGLLYVW